MEIRFDETIELAENAMLRARPELFYEWDFEKNDVLGLDIYKVTKGSHKKAWWECLDCGSSYDTPITNRIYKNSGCSYCAGKRINHTNSLASRRPDLIKEWHPTKNGELAPHNVTHRSNKIVWWTCSKCESDYDMMVNTRTSSQYGCPYCTRKRINYTNSLLSTGLDLIKEWHPTKNGELTPRDVSCGSANRVWWLGKCGHEWQTTVYSRTAGAGCPYCSNSRILLGFNDMWTTNPELAKLLVDPEDGYRYTQFSSSRVDWKCATCSYVIKSKIIFNIARKGLSCPRCSDGISFPEKFIYNIFKRNSVEFEYETSRSWSDNKRYDFYLPDYNWIIEVHGVQHYGKDFSTVGGRNLKDEQENDRLKECLAKENGIDNYIVIDAREPTIEWMKNSVLNSDIMKIIEEEIDFEEIGELSTKSLVKEACDLWHLEMKGISKIALMMNISSDTVRSYLKRGVEIGWCEYTTNYKKSIIQLDSELNYIKKWESGREISTHMNISAGSISSACNGKRGMVNKCVWMFESDYDKMLLEGLSHEEYMKKYYPKTK